MTPMSNHDAASLASAFWGVDLVRAVERQIMANAEVCSIAGDPDIYVLSICYDKTAPGAKVFQVVSAHKTKRNINRAIQKFRQKLYNDWYSARGNNWNRGKFVKGEKFVPNHLWKITPLKFT